MTFSKHMLRIIEDGSESLGEMKRTLFAPSYGLLGWVSIASLSVGALGTVLGKAFNLRCPFVSAGLACAGCGCSRAVTLALQDGLAAAFDRQPTALLLVVSLVLSATVSTVATKLVNRERIMGFITPRIAASAILLVALANLAYQLNANL